MLMNSMSLLKKTWGVFFILIPVLTACIKQNSDLNHMDDSKLTEETWQSWDKNPEMKKIFFPRIAIKDTSPSWVNYDIPVAPDITIAARMYYFKPNRPSIIYFHGNGEIIHDFDYFAKIFDQIGVNLFVVDYRGYGWSKGEISLRSLHEDALKAADFFLKTIGPAASGKNAPLIMGRSLGGAPASLIALERKDKFSGLILESTFADPVYLMDFLRIRRKGMEENLRRAFSPEIRLKKNDLPVLILHGTSDTLIDPKDAKINFAAIPHDRKKLKLIEGAEHNNIMSLRPQEYFESIDFFIRETRK